jgi:hypothetical protein
MVKIASFVSVKTDAGKARDLSRVRAVLGEKNKLMSLLGTVR